MVVGAVSKKQGVTLYGFNLSELPEGCIASIFAFTTPADACRLALISRVCNSAAESDVLWERFLPSDLDLIIARSEDGEVLLDEFPTMKHLYMRLADRPLLIDGATKSFWLDKPTGSKCLMIGARSLSIEWSDSPRCWRWDSIPESRFPEVAQLVNAGRLEIRGKIKTSILSPDTIYLAHLIFKTTGGAYGIDIEANGLVSNSDVKQRLSLTPEGEFPQDVFPRFGMIWRRRGRICCMEYPKERSDGWREVMIGRFSTHPGEEDEVELSVLEVDRGNMIGCLIIEGIELRSR